EPPRSGALLRRRARGPLPRLRRPAARGRRRRRAGARRPRPSVHALREATARPGSSADHPPPALPGACRRAPRDRDARRPHRGHGMSGSLDPLLQREVVVCVGAGGVGKTTIAAAVALHAAMEGKRAIVLTIDPARRLATALGLSALDNQATRVPLSEGARGELWAMMLDLERSWDEFVGRTVAPERREAILRNRFYKTLSSSLAGSQEYIATQKLHEIHASGRYDLVVLDTPPTQNALDFLDAPRRILDFLGNDTLRSLLGPA